VTNFGITSGGSVPPGISAKTLGQRPDFDVRYAPAPAAVASLRNLRRFFIRRPVSDMT
jgi:hypothetical protein